MTEPNDHEAAARDTIFNRHTIPTIVTILRRPTDVLREHGRVERWRVNGAERTFIGAENVRVTEDKYHVALRRPGLYVELSAEFV